MTLLDECPPLRQPWRKMIIADKGFLGMAHENAQEGDEMFYIHGSSSAVVLRKVRDRQDEHDRPKYIFVGQIDMILTEEDWYKYCRPVKTHFSKLDVRDDFARFRRNDREWHDAPKNWTFAELDLV